MGILNVTPDSFSDGGKFLDADRAIAHGLAMFAQGADIVDVGGESTRPGAQPVDPATELERVLPIISELSRHGPVSIDTSKPDVAAKSVAAGASVINDVSGFRDPSMVRVASETAATVCVMHMKGDPRTMQQAPTYDDVVTEVRDYLKRQADMLESDGISRSSIWIDPGIGFGKSLEHNLEILRRLDEIVATGLPVLVGLSRKSFIGKLTGDLHPSNRGIGSVAAMLAAAAKGARIVRVHDVPESVQALAVWGALS